MTEDGTSTWRPLRSAPGADTLVLAVDYALTGRPEATFSDLASVLPSSWAVWETRQPDTGRPDAEGYLDFWLSDPGLSGTRVDAVLGYCIGGVFAAELAERLSRATGEPVPVLLFDPEPPLVDGLATDARSAVEGLGSMLTAEQLRDALDRLDTSEAAAADVPDLAGELRGIYTTAARTACRSSGLDEDIADQLTSAFVRYLQYSSAAGRLFAEPAWSRATVVSSAQPTRWADCGADRVDCPVPHAQLLASACAADAVAGAVELY
ncbi:dienelactone hydrolase family protein [Streptomyces halobius]|uniref:Dienelactone hydrolase family protein n=1 Tax=Streptomyces halobius TaxID=2879846 RepID=A0ABY4MIG2_9ACTN|nr:dienelactone hydrolase family protein [Streptomyces halobius]UQA97425.1 dienelactone hydrolase family protein [Streptomyces halobius]